MTFSLVHFSSFRVHPAAIVAPRTVVSLFTSRNMSYIQIMRNFNEGINLNFETSPRPLAGQHLLWPRGSYQDYLAAARQPRHFQFHTPTVVQRVRAASESEVKSVKMYNQQIWLTNEASGIGTGKSLRRRLFGDVVPRKDARERDREN